MGYPDLIRFLWSITTTFFNTADLVLNFFSTEIEFLGTSFSCFELIFGAGIVTYLGYSITKWLLPFN